MFDNVLRRWQLLADGEPLRTHSSDLLPVRTRDGVAAMLKRARAPAERTGAALLRWWDGDGAVPVLAHDGDVVLMARATGARNLLQWAGAQADDDASRTICGVLARLHAPRFRPLPALRPLAGWFEDLRTQAGLHGGVLLACLEVAERLLSTPRDVIPLHGDCHHANVLDFGSAGWLAIDPKDRFGERGFDYAQVLVNPELPYAADPARFARQLALVAALARMPQARLAAWAAVQAALSVAWSLEDDDDEQGAHGQRTVDTALRALARFGADDWA